MKMDLDKTQVSITATNNELTFRLYPTQKNAFCVTMPRMFSKDENELNMARLQKFLNLFWKSVLATARSPQQMLVLKEVAWWFKLGVGKTIPLCSFGSMMRARLTPIIGDSTYDRLYEDARLGAFTEVVVEKVVSSEEVVDDKFKRAKEQGHVIDVDDEPPKKRACSSTRCS